MTNYGVISRSQWPSGLQRASAAARLLGLQVRIPPGTWMCVLHSKDKKVQSGQSGQSRSTMKYREQKKKNPDGCMDVCLL